MEVFLVHFLQLKRDVFAQEVTPSMPLAKGVTVQEVIIGIAFVGRNFEEDGVVPQAYLSW